MYDFDYFAQYYRDDIVFYKYNIYIDDVLTPSCLYGICYVYCSWRFCIYFQSAIKIKQKRKPLTFLEIWKSNKQSMFMCIYWSLKIRDKYIAKKLHIIT